jgi:UDP-3-O-[3-hydroxymyristoyl] glucosamine N-acyltransferase
MDSIYQQSYLPVMHNLSITASGVDVDQEKLEESMKAMEVFKKEYMDELEKQKEEKDGSNSPIIYGERVEIGEGCCFGPWSVLGDNVKIGNNVRIGSHTRIASNVEIAGHCRIGSHVIIKAQTELATGVFFDDFCISSGHCYIGEFSQIRYQSIIARNVHIEKECFFCAGVKLAYLDHTGNPVPVKNGLKIGSRTFVGDNSTILAGLQIAYGSVIGAHSLVTKDLNVSQQCLFWGPCKLSSRSYS